MDQAALLGSLPSDFRFEADEAFLAVNGDSFDWLPAESVDCVLTDPPYNISRETNLSSYAGNTIHDLKFDRGSGWDTYGEDEFQDLLGQWARGFERVLRPGGTFLIFTSFESLSDLEAHARAAGLTTMKSFSWRKPHPVPLNRKYMPLSAVEVAVIGTKGDRSRFGVPDMDTDPKAFWEVYKTVLATSMGSQAQERVDAAVAKVTTLGADRPEAVGKAAYDAIVSGDFDVVEPDKITEIPNAVLFDIARGKEKKAGGGHPTQKPLALLRYLTSVLTKPNDIVLDAFAGSGSVGVAALQMGRRPILVEMNEDYWSTVVNRMRDVESEEPT